MTSPFGQKSEENLRSVHPDLVSLFREVNTYYQCTILGGIRTLEEQRENIKNGLSHTLASKHLIQPDGYGHALDVAPDPVDFERKNFELDLILFAGKVLEIARRRGVNIRYGGDWNRNSEVSDESFKDLDHFELDET